MSNDYDVRLGPLGFVCLAGPADLTLGASIEAVGSVLTPAEPKPTPFDLQLPIRAASNDPDTRATGYRLRRQVLQLLSNPRWRAQGGLFFHFGADPGLNAWLIVGSGKIVEDNSSILLGDWTLELSDVYIVGRPGTHRPARRLEIADRRTGLAPLDTRGFLYSTDHAAQALPARPIVTPALITQLLLTRNRPPTTSLTEPRLLWKESAALDGDVASYLPDPAILTDPDRIYVDLDDSKGGVRVYNTAASTVDITNPASFNSATDTKPETIGWERVYGPVLEDPNAPFAIDNGACRLIWLGGTQGGLALEYWDATIPGNPHYARLGKIAGSPRAAMSTIVELDSERAVIEWRAGQFALRAILQRGWHGPRIEAYDDGGGNARLEYVPDAGAPTITASTPAWVDALTAGGRTVLWAKGTDSDTRAAFAAGSGLWLSLSGAGVAYTAPRAIVAQLGSPAGPASTDLASLAIADARSLPLLVTR